MISNNPIKKKTNDSVWTVESNEPSDEGKPRTYKGNITYIIR